MESVKVGEQLRLPVSINSRGAIVQSEGSPINDLKLDLMVTCIALNNHDRLVEENAELKKENEILEPLVLEKQNAITDLMKGNAELREFAKRMINDMTGYDSDQARHYWNNELDNLLAKHK